MDYETGLAIFEKAIENPKVAVVTVAVVVGVGLVFGGAALYKVGSVVLNKFSTMEGLKYKDWDIDWRKPVGNAA